MWLLKPEVAQQIRAGRALGYHPTLEERAKFEVAMREAYSQVPGRTADMPRNMSVTGAVATIAIHGVLTESPDCFAMLFGGGNTTYEQIRRGLALAESDPAIKSIVLDVASPGGELRGLFETFAALDAVTKPISSRASLAASAAYGIAAVAGPIEAITPGSEFGSIGVACSIYLDDDVLDMASTDAPRKRPDMATEAGQAMVREELDALHELFAGAIAKGRAATTGDDVTLKSVNSDFGQGGVLLAAASKKRGMIDRIATQPKRARDAKRAEGDVEPMADATPHQATPAPEGGSEPQAASNVVPLHPPTPRATGQRTKPMTKEELQAQHPATYAAIFDAGKTEGEAKERKRVNAHLKMGASHKAMDVATKAIASGASLADEECLADYLSAGKNADAQQARQADSDAAGAIVSGKAPVASTEGAKDNGDLVAAAMGLPVPAAATSARA